MTIIDIKEKYPLAYEELLKFFEVDESLLGRRYFLEDYLERSLYSFFDYYGIIIKITFIPGDEFVYDSYLEEYPYIEDEFKIKSMFESYIIVKPKDEELFIDSNEIRHKVEIQAFKKAFEILEEKLKLIKERSQR